LRLNFLTPFIYSVTFVCSFLRLFVRLFVGWFVCLFDSEMNFILRTFKMVTRKRSTRGRRDKAFVDCIALMTPDFGHCSVGRSLGDRLTESTGICDSYFAQKHNIEPTGIQ